jgi:hypothetical protein
MLARGGVLAASVAVVGGPCGLHRQLARGMGEAPGKVKRPEAHLGGIVEWWCEGGGERRGSDGRRRLMRVPGARRSRGGAQEQGKIVRRRSGVRSHRGRGSKLGGGDDLARFGEDQ